MPVYKEKKCKSKPNQIQTEGTTQKEQFCSPRPSCFKGMAGGIIWVSIPIGDQQIAWTVAKKHQGHILPLLLKKLEVTDMYP